jgi:choloylglycine hydrolase
MNALPRETEADSVNQFFHILGSVEQVEGCLRLDNGNERTQYTSCCNTGRAIYYCKTYGSHRITSVNLHRESLDACALHSYPLTWEEHPFYPQNKPHSSPV